MVDDNVGESELAKMEGFWRAVHSDESQLVGSKRLRARLHAALVLPAYAYQFLGAAPVGISAWIEGYSKPGALGAIEAGLYLGGVVGAQHMALGYNAVQAATAYPTAGKALRNKLPRFFNGVSTYWEANSSFIVNGAAVSSFGVQSAVYNEAYSAQPKPNKKTLDKFTNKAIIRGTVFSAGIGSGLAGIGKGLQWVADISNNYYAEALSNGFEREVIEQPGRTAAIVLGLTILNGARKITTNLRDEHKASNT